MPKIIIISGPTASAKSRLAMQLAQQYNAAIVNADSMQIYHNFATLTASPTMQDKEKIPHYLYNFLQPSQIYSVAHWLVDCQEAIEKIILLNQIPIIVGGTGLYIHTLLKGISNVPTIDNNIRLHVRKLANENLAEAYAILQKQDFKMAQTIHPHDRQRIARALEVIQGTGKSLLYWQEQNEKNYLNFNCIKIYINPAKQAIAHNVYYRLQKIFKDINLQQEFSTLTKQYKITELPLYKALGAKEFHAYLKNEMTQEKALELACIATKQYAKRQQTWLKKYFTADMIINNCYQDENIVSIQQCINF